ADLSPVGATEPSTNSASPSRRKQAARSARDHELHLRRPPVLLRPGQVEAWRESAWKRNVERRSDGRLDAGAASVQVLAQRPGHTPPRGVEDIQRDLAW